MKSISLTSSNKIFLEDPTITENTFTITFQVINEVGSYVKNVDDADISNVNAIYDNDQKKWYATFQIAPDTKGKYFRLTFDIKDTNGNFYPSDHYLVELVVTRNSSTVQLVPVSYFRDYILQSGLDEGVQQKIATYPTDAIQELLSAATEELQNETKLVFTKKTKENERHNWHGESLRETWWLLQTFERPIVSVESYQLWFANKKIFDVDVDIVKNYLLIHKIEGNIQFMPTVGQPFAPTYMNSLESTLMSLVHMLPGSSYVPDVFRISYTYGLDFMNLEPEEQSGIRNAIARRTMLNSVFIVNKDLMKGSESQSADGVSYSFSNNAKQWFDTEQANQEKWVWNLMRKYNTLVDINVA